MLGVVDLETARPAARRLGGEARPFRSELFKVGAVDSLLEALNFAAIKEPSMLAETSSE